MAEPLSTDEMMEYTASESSYIYLMFWTSAVALHAIESKARHRTVFMLSSMNKQVRRELVAK
jgi:hypothetical protein